MSTLTLEALAERVDRLEGENRLLKRIGGASFLGLLALVAFGTDAFRSRREIAAEKIVLTGADGSPRARLEVRPQGPAFALLDVRGHDQVLLNATDNGGASLDFFENQDVRASFTNLIGLGPSLNLVNHSRRSRAEVFAGDDGSLGVALRRYQRGAGLRMEADGTSKLSFLGARGEEQAGLALVPDGTTRALGKAPSLGQATPDEINLLDPLPRLDLAARKPAPTTQVIAPNPDIADEMADAPTSLLH